MKTTFFITLSLLFTLQSCADKKASPQSTSASSAQNKVVLSAFNDMISRSTLNEELLTEFPRTVNFSSEMTSVKNQGRRGTCTFFAATALLEAALKMDKGIDVNLSEEYLIYSTKAQGNYSDVEASHISVNLQSIKKGGILLEKDWSYIPSMFEYGQACESVPNDENAPLHCFVHTPDLETLMKVVPAESIKTGFIRKNTNDIIKYLATKKRPLSISLPVNFSGWHDNGSVYYNEELRQECLSNPESCGAHSVVLTGYDLDKQVFYFKNSWGSDWGVDGYGELSFELVDKYVEGYVYFAKVEGDIDMPADAGMDNFKLEDIEITSALTNLTIDLNVKIKGHKIHGRYIEVQNYLGYQMVDDESNSAYPIYDSYHQNIYVHGNPFNMNMSQEVDNLLSFPNETMLDPKIEQYLAPEYRLVIITGVLLYSDTSIEPVLIIEKTTPIN